MSRFRHVWLLLLFSGCMPLKLPSRPVEPTAPDHGGIIASVTVYEGAFQKFHAHWARFAQVKADGTLDEHRIASNFSAGDALYLLDLPPGTYAPISAVYQSMGNKHTVTFTPALAKSSAIEVKRGALQFAGAFDFKMKKQGWHKRSEFIKVETGKEARIGAFSDAKVHLANTLWSDGIARELADLGPSRAPVLDAHKKVIPPTPTRRFTYVDDLKWGAPRQVTGGFEWREPEDRARIALTFLTPELKGYRTKEEYLKYMRSVGSPEDTHLVSEVAFSSRTAYSVRYTTYYYPQGTLVGSLVRVYVTQTIMIPDSQGLYLFHYRAEKSNFKRFYAIFKRFVGRVILPDS